ncbi:MAG: 7,8-dihydro-6-hydroxymethylpterin-pyrophosphokinase, partial [Lentimonas sp.]
MIKRIIFCLGSNIGDRESHLNFANSKLKNRLNLKEIKTSSIFENAAMLLENSPQEWNIDFYNIAISADVDLE